MRTKPITRDEVRFNGERITTLPIDSVKEDKWGDVEPIKRLWVPLLRSLNRAQKRDWDNRAEQRAQAAMVGIRGFKAPEPIRPPWPYRVYAGPCTCRHCQRQFYRTRRSGHHYCSDRCAHHARVSAQSRATSQARAAARVGWTCEHCGTPFEAQRSTRRFCSTRCRVAGHRGSRK